MSIIEVISRAVIFLSASLAAHAANPPDPSGPLPGHSSHGQAFNVGPRQAAYLMDDGTGTVVFPIKTDRAIAQKLFNQGVGQLHGFWYFEAERSFRQVLKIDPDNPMAYWGMAMANHENAKRAKPFIVEAEKCKTCADERGQLWIEALAAFHRDSNATHSQRQETYIKNLQAISDKFPEDLEAMAFIALQHWRNGDGGKGKEHYEKVDALIGKVLAKNPLHPSHHYRIHLWDYREAPRALDSVGRCGQAAPAIAHMWHMPGHILSRLKRYHEAAWQMEASARVDHAHMMRDRVMPDQIHNFAHNNEWLTRNLSYAGRVRHALAMAKNMMDLPRLPEVKADGQWTVSGQSSHAYGKRHLQALLIEYELWAEILALRGTHYLPPGNEVAEQTRWNRWVASAFFNTGKLTEAQATLAELERLRAAQDSAKKSAGDEAEAKAKKENKKDAEVSSARQTAENKFNATLNALDVALAEVKMHQALTAMDLPKAKEWLGKATDIAGDRKALLQQRVGDTEAALKTAEAAVKSADEQARPLAVQAWLLHTAGQADKAKAAFEHLRRIAPEADLEVATFARLKPLAEALKLPADWRLGKSAMPDLGVRPDLDTLGPFQWSPSTAPEWKLADRNGKFVSLADYRGRPLLLIFYLGKGCAHCLEQLNTFATAREKFHKIGVELVAVSTDSVEGLKATFPTKSLALPEYPFPMISDERLSVFKAYRAFDDFEQVPLHGTFLIDSTGHVRWQDISFEPFKAVDFLLEEAQRLLGTPNTR